MKKFLLILSACILLFTSTSFAQTDSTIVEKMMNEICLCIENALENNSEEKGDTISKKCLQNAFIHNQKEIEVITQKSVEKKIQIGLAIAFGLAEYCPARAAIFTNNQDYKIIDQNSAGEFPFDSAIFKPADPKTLLNGKFTVERIFKKGLEIERSDKSAYSVSQNGIWIDYTKENKFKSKYGLVILSNGKYEFTLKSTDNPRIAAASEIGDKHTVRLIGVNVKIPNRFYISRKDKGKNVYYIINKSEIKSK